MIRDFKAFGRFLWDGEEAKKKMIFKKTPKECVDVNSDITRMGSSSEVGKCLP